MRPDHTADYTASPSLLPLAPPTLDIDASVDGGHAQTPARPLARITFCFAWLFGLEAFLSAGATDELPSRMDRGI
ncbi:hypothetical protein [Paraburkholderia sp. DHOC27]|uniref:hypothetical protein n=1 Tax=Paraburkholderia sp. DHOC27 TaxID=2303330 RepID=UPI00216B63E4|nr:hypothetical protein [Paraburkholderia sp. DHOC27]